MVARWLSGGGEGDEAHPEAVWRSPEHRPAGRPVVVGLEAACQFLDAIPRRQGGDWLPGGYGCRWLRFSWLAWRLDERWGTGVWPGHERAALARRVGGGHSPRSGESPRRPGGGL
jgi:hypothetical protein